MVFLLISILAGILTVLAPCIFPLLPIVIGSATADGKRVSTRSIVVIGSLSLSVVLFSLLLKASTLLIDIPQSFWNTFSGTVIIVVGLAIVFPSVWDRLPFLQKVQELGSKAMGVGFQKKNYLGDAMIGLALGPVFTTCSPTYLFIIATILPVGFLVGFIYLLGFTFGLALSLLLIAFFGGQLIKKITAHMDATTRVKKIFGVLIVLVGIAILTGYDKKLEAAILDSGYGATIEFEESLIERFAPKTDKESSVDQASPTVLPNHSIQAQFEIHTHGTKRTFTDKKYHQRSTEVYIELPDPHVVHVKKAGTTWGEFFATLPMSLTKDCLTTGTGQKFCSSDNQQLRFWINEVETANALELEIQSNDMLKVVYGR
jgi:cytochrome c-type biogenesis protein